LDLAVVGQFTDFQQGSTTASLGNGINVNSVTVTDATRLTLNVTISPSAVAGTRDLTITTPTRTVSQAAVFTIQAAGGASISSVSPSSGAQGSTLNVAVTGVNTSFAQGVTTASFGPGSCRTGRNICGPQHHG
jgi:hypothetical protein